MQVTVFGATGMVGKRVVEQALARRMKVVAFGRNVEDLIDKDKRNDLLKAIKGYVFEEDDVFAALAGSDAVISVIGGAFDGTDKARSLGIKNIIAQMERAGIKRIIALGGLGILQDNDTTLLIDTPEYPEEYKPVGKEHLQAYLFLKESNLDWTFVCAPDIKDETGTGEYHLNAEYPPVPNHGQIAAGDLAGFMLGQADDSRFIQKRVGISN